MAVKRISSLNHASVSQTGFIASAGLFLVFLPLAAFFIQQMSFLEPPGRVQISHFPTHEILQCSVHWWLPTQMGKLCHDAFTRHGLHQAFEIKLLAAAISALITASLCGYLLRRKNITEGHLRGTVLIKGWQAQRLLKKVSTAEVKAHGHSGGSWISSFLSPKSGSLTGLWITDFFQLSIDRETRHMLVQGATGGGKTQFLLRVLTAAISRKDKLLIHDVKGDFTSYFSRALLVTPLDARSPEWAIAQDVQTPQQAREFSASMIKAGKDPFWSNAAREILTGYIVYLQNTKHDKWTWKDLTQLSSIEYEDLTEIFRQHYPNAVNFSSGGGVTANNIRATVSAYFSLIHSLADAWSGDDPTREKISFKKWTLDDNPKRRVLILQRSAEYDDLSQAWINAAVSLMGSLISSPRMNESKKRRFWLILDEFYQMGELRPIGQVLDLGRSKGVRVVLALQSMQQLDSLYGRELAANWINNIGTHVITRLGTGEAANAASKLLGQREIERRSANVSQTDDKFSRTTSFQTQQSQVYLPSQFSSELGFRNEPLPAIRTMIVGLAGYAFIVDIGITKLRERREAVILADWAKPRYEQLPDYTPSVKDEREVEVEREVLSEEQSNDLPKDEPEPIVTQYNSTPQITKKRAKASKRLKIKLSKSNMEQAV